MTDKRRRRNWFEEFFGSESFENIEDMIEHMIDKLGVNMDDPSEQPYVYGFSITRKPGEDPEIRSFGNFSTEDFNEDYTEYENETTDVKPVSIDERKPLIDVMESDDHVYVVAEMPGVEKEDINLHSTEWTVEITATKGESNYSEIVEFPVKVDPNSASATFKNGVLEIIFDKTDTDQKVAIDIS
ncbi:heat shock protein Hsp20 [Methanohalobium evestigatum Z-7303]|uniref:Heat shock protein Hsp20 n=1 Tax=Methanohalobium evestigatum (strain ATCC BAA-1072 / DSM 3721 / NBRC 107634 / OCM 161 / Z-7303) TaxID=644295 RepID=D7E772_METEZ|nr:archaeal heat shock protein Hsp20 [Methanohalobium evestigatum]ADI73821.1 heat shock protein Hsp20 [Methanohalobium evestigatum Z-7303]